jgi:hypothetical protein
MLNNRLKTPIVLVVYKRPGKTKLVLKEISKVSPEILFVVGDGSRDEKSDEIELVNKTRDLIKDYGGEYDLITNYSEINLGLRMRISSGLNWVFEQVDEAIILEDDCVPNSSFFYFCEELLQRYKNDDRIMVISGNNFQKGQQRTNYSYYFSRYNHCWGWATWRRAWEFYDDKMYLWPKVRDGNWLMDIHDQDTRVVNFWKDIFQNVYKRELDSWAYCWTFACWMQSGLTIIPNVNLVSNIGFDIGATHTMHKSRSANIPVEDLKFPLKHPPFIIRDSIADKYTQKIHFGTSFLMLLKKNIARFINL